MGVVQVGEVEGPHPAAVGHGHVQLLEEVDGVAQVEQEHVHLAHLGEALLVHRVLPGLAGQGGVVVGVGVLGQLLGQAQVLQESGFLLGGGVLEHPVEHGVVVGGFVHPTGDGEVHPGQNHRAEGGAAQGPLPAFAGPQQGQGPAQTEGAQGPHRQVCQLAPAVEETPGQKPQAVAPPAAPAGEAPQGEHPHGQEAHHLDGLAVEGVEVGGVALVAEDKEGEELDGQVGPPTLELEGAEQEEQQPRPAQGVDGPQHLDVVHRQLLAGEEIEGQVAQQGQAHEHQVDGGVGADAVQAEEEVCELFQGGVPLEHHAEGVLVDEPGVVYRPGQGVGGHHPAVVAVVGQADAAPGKEGEGDHRQGQQRQHPGVVAAVALLPGNCLTH